MLDRWRELADRPALPPLPVNGRDLNAQGVPPGPQLGRILQILKEEFLENRLKTREELLVFAENRIKSRKKLAK